MLQFKKYKKEYNKELILEIENVILENGVYWMKGNNGSGKSTLLKCIAGIIPFEGEIFLYGINNIQKNMTAYRRILSYGEAEPAYPEFMKGIDLIHFYQNVRLAETKQVDQLLSLFGINNFQSKEIGTYSSGMKKKLSLALAFIGNPKLILLDEPLITLDKETTEAVLHLLTAYSNQGTSILFTSHQEFKDNANIPMHQLLLKDHTLHLL